MDQITYDLGKLRLENEQLKEWLLKSEERYRTLYEGDPSMYVSVDAEGTIISANSSGAKQLGYAKGELIGKSVLMVFHPEDHETVTDQLKKCLQHPEKLSQWDLRKVRKDNTVIWVRESARAIIGDDEEELIMIVCEDVTENKRAEEILRRAYDELETTVREKTSDLLRANESLQAEIRERERTETELKIINSITQAMNQSIDLDDVFRIALDKVVEQGHVDIACIYLADCAKNEAVLQDHRGLPDDFLRRASRIPKPRGVTWKVINSGEILNVKNASEDPDVGLAGRDLGFRSMLGIPIKLETKTIGVLWLLSYTEHVFTKPEEELLVSIGDQIAIAVARANLYRELTRKNRYETIISAVTRSVHQSINLQNVLDNAVEAIHKNIEGCHNVCIYMVEGQEAVMKAYKGYPGWFIEKVGRIPYPRGFTWKTIIEEKPLYVSDAEKDSVIGPAGIEVGTKSYASMPINYEGKSLGCVNINSLEFDAFDEEDLRLLDTVAKQIETAVNNAQQAEALQLTQVTIDRVGEAVFWVAPDARFFYVNNAACSLLGYSREELLSMAAEDVGLDFRGEVWTEAWEGFKQMETGAFESHCRTRDGKIWPLEVTVNYMEFGAKKFICVFARNIAERKRQEEQIRHMAMHDYLTDLANRRALQAALDSLLKDSDTLKKHALIVMDLDNFKLINDTLGHIEGDQVLIDLAKVLRNAMRPCDLLARVGGDEFAMIVNNVSRSQAKSIAERFLEVIRGQTYYIKGYNFQINLSVGITLIDKKSEPQMIMASAYSALAEAKYEGKNRIVIHRSKDYSGGKSDRASQWGIRINDALQENRFSLHYQPVVTINNCEVLYTEALVRMIEVDNNMIYPKAFIPAAERFGLMSKLDRWVVESVMSTLRKQDGLKIFINLSGSSLRDESLLGFILNAIKVDRKVANRIGFEITEFAAITNMDRIQEWMSKLKEFGCQFALDDFGMGYSSFAHLIELPVDFVKIESSFVRSLDTDPTSSAIVKAILTISRLMGKEVIAEGVETESVRKLLRRLKVKYGQGNYFKTPSEDTTYMS